MDLKKEIKVGDRVLCIKEKDIPTFIGKIWTVRVISNELIYCENLDEYTTGSVNRAYVQYVNCFPFRSGEVVLVTPLLEELL